MGMASGGIHGVIKSGWAQFGIGHHSMRNPDEMRQEYGMVGYGS